MVSWSATNDFSVAVEKRRAVPTLRRSRSWSPSLWRRAVTESPPSAVTVTVTPMPITVTGHREADHRRGGTTIECGHVVRQWRLPVAVTCSDGFGFVAFRDRAAAGLSTTRKFSMLVSAASEQALAVGGEIRVIERLEPMRYSIT